MAKNDDEFLNRNDTAAAGASTDENSGCSSWKKNNKMRSLFRFVIPNRHNVKKEMKEENSLPNSLVVIGVTNALIVGILSQMYNPQNPNSPGHRRNERQGTSRGASVADDEMMNSNYSKSASFRRKHRYCHAFDSERDVTSPTTTDESGIATAHKHLHKWCSNASSEVNKSSISYETSTTQSDCYMNHQSDSDHQPCSSKTFSNERFSQSQTAFPSSSHCSNNNINCMNASVKHCSISSADEADDEKDETTPYNSDFSDIQNIDESFCDSIFSRDASEGTLKSSQNTIKSGASYGGDYMSVERRRTFPPSSEVSSSSNTIHGWKWIEKIEEDSPHSEDFNIAEGSTITDHTTATLIESQNSRQTIVDNIGKERHEMSCVMPVAEEEEIDGLSTSNTDSLTTETKEQDLSEASKPREIQTMEELSEYTTSNIRNGNDNNSGTNELMDEKVSQTMNLRRNSFVKMNNKINNSCDFNSDTSCGSKSGRNSVISNGSLQSDVVVGVRGDLKRSSGQTTHDGISLSSVNSAGTSVSFGVPPVRISTRNNHHREMTNDRFKQRSHNPNHSVGFNKTIHWSSRGQSSDPIKDVLEEERYDDMCNIESSGEFESSSKGFTYNSNNNNNRITFSDAQIIDGYDSSSSNKSLERNQRVCYISPSATSFASMMFSRDAPRISHRIIRNLSIQEQSNINISSTPNITLKEPKFSILKKRKSMMHDEEEEESRGKFVSESDMQQHQQNHTTTSTERGRLNRETSSDGNSSQQNQKRNCAAVVPRTTSNNRLSIRLNDENNNLTDWSDTNDESGCHLKRSRSLNNRRRAGAFSRPQSGVSSRQNQSNRIMFKSNDAHDKEAPGGGSNLSTMKRGSTSVTWTSPLQRSKFHSSSLSISSKRGAEQQHFTTSDHHHGGTFGHYHGGSSNFLSSHKKSNSFVDLEDCYDNKSKSKQRQITFNESIMNRGREETFKNKEPNVPTHGRMRFLTVPESFDY